MTIDLDPIPCPSCGGAGGGPIGRAGGAWDDEEYVCPRCEGTGFVVLSDVMVQSSRPGVAKTSPSDGQAREGSVKRKASA